MKDLMRETSPGVFELEVSKGLDYSPTFEVCIIDGNTGDKIIVLGRVKSIDHAIALIFSYLTSEDNDAIDYDEDNGITLKYLSSDGMKITMVDFMNQRYYGLIKKI